MIFDRLLPKGYTRESFAGKTAHPLDPARVETLKQFVEESRKELDVPGVAIGLIDHGKVVFAGGFGVRELGKADAVDADTLFMIRVQHQSADDADARTHGRSEEIWLGHASDPGAAQLQTWRRRDYQAGADQAPDLRLYRSSATGSGVAAEQPERYA
jgi:hypothetical protein